MTTQLLTKGFLGHLSLKNRYIVAPMTRVSAEPNGVPNQQMKEYYERYAKGGFGTIITEGVYLDETYSQGYLKQPGLANKKHTDAWKPIVESVHVHDTKMIAQLMHAGGQAQGNAYKDETIAPSAVAPKGEQLPFYGGSGPFDTPNEISADQINEVKQAFAKAARNAKDAGFDGVEIHGANGYLLDQFLTDYLNKRDDQYGGSLEKRLQFTLEVIDEVRQSVGDDYLVGIRISQGKVADQAHKWPNGEKDAEYIFSQLGNTSLDYIHVTDRDATEASFGEGTKTLAGAAKTFSNLPTIANGGLVDQQKAEALIVNGEADFVSVGTGALANPDLPNRVEKGIELNEFNAKAILMPRAEIKEHELKAEVIQN
ncbi:NADH:flavin oxidoreductase [Pseudalkalibacillus berkeleyi]|uniref:NADH:flavin oxidoreductase n=1 Tax=Pseudalkalibacillus berkeleyi TaxID=1069813 RepID=A0ABS9GXZ8_9BACL|nr:NADH:flavin oxidoreductase [Pseudalkalibacillus berkeleyi]MCF6136696.1 NADH:flavin oxidoreductase [Pseudalkalibacillus berkeleyi]